MHPTRVAFWVGKSGTCTPKNCIFVVFKANSEGEKVVSTMLFSPEWVFRSRVLEQYLHYKLRGWRKVFHNKFDERCPPQNTPKTRKPIAERTSHGWHGYTHQGVQQSLLHQTTTTPPTECTERTEPSGREKTPTDGTDEHRLGVYGIPAISTLPNSVFCWRTAHSKHLCKSVPSVGEKIFPQNARNAQKLLAEKRLPRIARMNTD